MKGLIEHISSLPPEIAVLTIAAMPVFELRGSIPLGVIYFKMPLWKALTISIVGNLIPVPFLLLLLKPISEIASKWSITRRFFEWLYGRAREKGVSVKRLKLLGLYMFVAIPVPGTGAWMGSVIAEVMNIDFKSSLLMITLGVITAGIVITFVSSFGPLAVVAFFGLLFMVLYILAKEGNLERTDNK